jgi:hypothetical protein
LAQAEAPANCPESPGQSEGGRFGVVPKESNDLAAVSWERSGDSVLPELNGFLADSDLLGDGSLRKAAIEAELP